MRCESPEDFAATLLDECTGARDGWVAKVYDEAAKLIRARDAAIHEEALAPFRECLERLRGDIGSRASNWGAYRDTCARWRDELTRLLGLLPSAKDETDG